MTIARALPPMSSIDWARFWSNVDRSGGPNACWIWIPALGSALGYGIFIIRGRSLYVHRLSLASVEPPPFVTALALHSCDFKACVNPIHLHWGTQKDNIQECVERGRNWNGGIRAAEASFLRTVALQDKKKR